MIDLPLQWFDMWFIPQILRNKVRSDPSLAGKITQTCGVK
jgi:hypothetical protein